MDQHSPAPVMPVLKFIHDEPAPKDAFGSHDRIANAIATAIHTQKTSKVIGLLGAWGSGKTTVVRYVEEKLGAIEGGANTHVFTYDAWLHQSDPIRRSFLEELIKFLLSRPSEIGLPEADWKDALETLSKRKETSEKTSTPTLTPTGRVALVSLLLLPPGAQFIGYEWIEKFFAAGAPSYVRWLVEFGVIILLAPIAIATFTYYRWRPRKWPFTWPWPPLQHSPFLRRPPTAASKHENFSRLRRLRNALGSVIQRVGGFFFVSEDYLALDNWTKNRAPHQSDSILSLITNKEVTTEGSITTREPEPTAIEFQKLFRKMMGEVSKDGKRFIFVIDNLDRLPHDEAIKLWSTIRSLFLGASDVPNGQPSYMPTIILPIDRSAVERMYVTENIADADLARSFMEKTFDLTFRVTRPVVSDWRGYLSDQMKNVFGEYLETGWAYQVGVLLDKSLSQQGAPPITPRMINTHINRIGALWLQWRGLDIDFASIAYYAIFLGENEFDIRGVVAMPQAHIASLDPNWRRSVAAIYYGCKPEAAMQILIEQPLRTAIDEGRETSSTGSLHIQARNRFCRIYSSCSRTATWPTPRSC